MNDATATATQVDEASRDELVAKARELGELAWSHREETERNRRMPDEVMEALRASGLMKLLRHRRYGGAEAHPLVWLDVGRELARGFGALGWVYSVLSFHEWFMAFTSDELQEEVWGSDQDVFVADTFAPVGKIEEVSDGFTATGTWRFTSGIEWADWVAVGGIAPGQAHPILFFVPRSEVKVTDDWHTLGLRGSASRAITLDKVFVPTHRTFSLGSVAGPGSRDAVKDDGPLWRMPLFSLQGFSVTIASIGIAQRAIEEYGTAQRARMRPFEAGAQQRENPAAQFALAEASTQWDSLWALAQKYIQDGWDQATSGREWMWTDEERAKYFTWRASIARSAVELTDQLYIASGGMALFDSNPMQQVFRDVHATAAHLGVDRGDAYSSRGRVAMGLEGHPFQ